MAAPKTSLERNKQAMSKAFGRVDSTISAYEAAVTAARHKQARLIVDPLRGRYSYQVDRKLTTLSFGRWLLQKLSLHGSYMKIDPEIVLRAYAGVLEDALTDRRFYSFGEESYDWLTPLVQDFIGHHIVEDYFVIRLTSYTIPFDGQKEALPSFKFVEDLVPGKFPPR